MSIFVNKFTALEWKTVKRKEVLELFEENVYGKRPSLLDNVIVKHNIVDSIKHKNYIKESMSMSVFGLSFSYDFITPLVGDNFPTMLYIMHPAQIAMYKNDNAKSAVPIDFLVNKGYCIIVLFAHEIAHDTAKQAMGIFSLIERIRINKNTWGVMSAWAWGASQALDFLLTQSNLNVNKVIVAGHSRGGKAALWAAATDERFCGVISNCSGCGGSALARGCTGESVKSINQSFPLWFAPKYVTYSDNENALPIDQHQLVGLIAPRKCFISSAAKDDWADPNGEFISAMLASQYYKLYDKKGLVCDEKPLVKKLYGQGSIAYWRSNREHQIDIENWLEYVKFFN